MRLKIFVALAASVTLAACASEQSYQVKQDRLKGLTEAELIARMGAPTSSYKMDDGGKALLYKWELDRGEGYRVRRCDTTYVLNKAKRVTSVSFVGRDCIAPDDEEEQFLDNGLPSFMEY